MSTFTYPVMVGNPEGQRFVQIEALVDTGSTFSLFPGDMLRQLGVRPLRRVRFELADGRRVEKELGQTVLRVDGLEGTQNVVFGDAGEAALIGAVTLETFLLAVDPIRGRLVPIDGLLKALV